MIQIASGLVVAALVTPLLILGLIMLAVQAVHVVALCVMTALHVASWLTKWLKRPWPTSSLP